MSDAVVKFKPLATSKSLSNILNFLDAQGKASEISTMTEDMLTDWASNMAEFVGLNVSSVSQDEIVFIPGHQIILDVA